MPVKPRIALWGVTSGIVIYPEKKIWVWFYIYCAHKQSLNIWITVSSADLQKEQSGDLTFSNFKRVYLERGHYLKFCIDMSNVLCW